MKKIFDLIKTSIISALLKYEKLVEKDAVLVHNRVIIRLGTSRFVTSKQELAVSCELCLLYFS